MSTLKEKYDKILSEREIIIKQINELKNSDILKRYFDLCNQNEQLVSQQKELYKKMKIEEYSSCNHIWVNTLHDYDSHEGRSYNYHGCIKCGLDQRVFYMYEQCHNLDWFTLEQRVMYDFMYGGAYRSGIDTKVLCDLDLAKAIYSKIKEAHPYIDDETTRKYFEIALDNIRKIKVNAERKESRAKRLLLSPKFNKWTGWDVSSR